MLMPRAVFFANICGAAVLAGCALTKTPPPDEIRSDAFAGIEVREAWAGAATGEGSIGDHWLESFGDPQLDALVEEALARNPDLRVAGARVEQSDAYLQIARAALKPWLTVVGTGGLKFGGGSDPSGALQGLMLAASWEPDLWGRLRYGRNAAEESLAASQADLEFARQALAAQVARSWFTATETRLQLVAAEVMVASSRQLESLALDRQRVGTGSERDVATASAEAGRMKDTASQARLAHTQALRALEILVGRYPSAELQAAESLPAMPGPIPVGMPLQMLDRRPDLVAAERRVAAAFNRVGEAKAAQLPRIRLNASVATLDSDVLDLKDDYDNPTAGAGATLFAPLYRGGQLKAEVVLRDAERKEALARYASGALRALADVENGLTASAILEERAAILRQVLADEERTLDYEKAAYRIGRQDLRSVNQQQVETESARIALLRVLSEQLTQRVNLHLSLGGSFAEPITVASAPP